MVMIKAVVVSEVFHRVRLRYRLRSKELYHILAS